MKRRSEHLRWLPWPGALAPAAGTPPDTAARLDQTAVDSLESENTIRYFNTFNAQTMMTIARIAEFLHAATAHGRKTSKGPV